jgi:two-component system chemotaxis sensor kinase CheA
MDDLLADFIAETREMLEASGGELVAWEANPADRARLDTIFRFVHTVKGNCGFFDFPRLASLSHAAEDALADCRAGRREPDQQLVTAVLAIIRSHRPDDRRHRSGRGSGLL